MSDGCGITPLDYNVIVTYKPVEEKTAGGLYMPETSVEREQFAQTEGVIVSISPAAFKYDPDVELNAPRVGDTVVFSRYAGTQIKGRDGQDYWALKDKSILGVVTA